MIWLVGALIQIKHSQVWFGDSHFLTGKEIIMRHIGLKRALLAAAVIACGVSGSVG